MSWMLVSAALALAHELGVFDARDNSGIANARAVGPDARYYLQQLNFRRQRLPSLLFVISNLLSSRIGCPPLMPCNYELPSLDGLLLVDPQWAKLMTSWVHLTRLMQNIREKLFTKPNINNCQQVDFESLEQWRAQLAAWKENHREIGSK